MIVRKATPDDLPSIRLLERQTESAAHWGAREYAALFAADAPARVILVALGKDDSQRVDGFVIARCGLEDWEIENVVVADRGRRQGLGAALIRAVLAEAQRMAATSVLLEVRESNAPARLLYEKLGFSEVGRRPKYYNKPIEDALLLSISVAVL